MRPFLLAYLVFITCYVTVLPVGKLYPKWFLAYQKEHHKNYTSVEERRAYKILKGKYEHIRATHLDGVTLKLHADSDRNLSYVNYHVMTGRRLRARRENTLLTSSHDIPSSWDWRSYTYVTPPLRQGTCGGCFAFAGIGHLEYWFKKKTGRLRALSVQEALDCSGPESDGCDGGLMEDVYKHSYGNPIGPVDFDRWTGGDSVCKHRHIHPYVRVMDYVSMSDEFGDPVEGHLARNIYYYGPIPVAVDSTSSTFEHYSSGVIRKNQCGTDVDHAVLAVGYTPDYWILKNSWGTSWGEKGYFRVARGQNACGINSYAAFAIDVQV